MMRLETGHCILISFYPDLFQHCLFHSRASLTLISLEHEGMLLCHRTSLACRYDQAFITPLLPFYLTSSRTQMPIEPLWPWDNSERQMKTSLCVKITPTPPVNLHKNSPLNTKLKDMISKSRRVYLDCDLYAGAGPHLDVMWSGWGSAPAGPRPWLSAGGRDLSPAGEGWASALSGWVQASLGLNPAGFPDDRDREWQTTWIKLILSFSLKDWITIGIVTRSRRAQRQEAGFSLQCLKL